MDNRKIRHAAAVIAIGFGVTAAIQTPQDQGSCTLDQDEIVRQARSALAPSSGLLRASPGRLGGAAADIADANEGCALDVVVALGTVRPDAAGEIAQAVSDLFPDQEAQLLAAGRQFGEDAIEPAAGFDGPYDGPYDDDRFDDDDVSPS